MTSLQANPSHCACQHGNSIRYGLRCTLSYSVELSCAVRMHRDGDRERAVTLCRNGQRLSYKQTENQAWNGWLIPADCGPCLRGSSTCQTGLYALYWSQDTD